MTAKTAFLPMFLPMTREELSARGWDAIDILLVSGDDYFDSPTHGVAVIGRVLENAGYRVALITRPDWTRPESLAQLGIPRLFVGIGAGAVDSTLNNYTADLAPRKTDVYAAKNSHTKRPNFATAVYSGAAKAAFPGVPIVLGGVEASTRRFAYYDYLKKKIRRSVLVDTRADLLVFGSGEHTVLEVADRLKRGAGLADIAGTAVLTKKRPNNGIELPTFDALQKDSRRLIHQTRLLEENLGPHKRAAFFQHYEEGFVLSHPQRAFTTQMLDETHALPFLRTSHPSYGSGNEIPAAIPVRWSIISQRGCPGGCSFCALAYHQGREVVSRSEESIIDEITELSQHENFHGTITDIGGPTANAYGLAYKDNSRCGCCHRVSCLYPRICSNLDTSQDRFVTLLKTVSRLPGIRHVFIASGIRHDLALRNRTFISLLAKSFTGGHLKAAPEHTSDIVLNHMRKPPIAVFEEFERVFRSEGRKQGLKQYVVPYFIAGFPGCTPEAANHSGSWLQQRNQRLQQVQNFIPLPGTMAAAMYAAGVDERGRSVYVPNAPERRRQKALLLGKTKRLSVKPGKRITRTQPRRKGR